MVPSVLLFIVVPVSRKAEVAHAGLQRSAAQAPEPHAMLVLHDEANDPTVAVVDDLRCTHPAMGAACCALINHSACAEKLDGNPPAAQLAAPGVEAHIGRANERDWLADGAADVAFTGNFCEPLPNGAAWPAVLGAVRATRCARAAAC